MYRFQINAHTQPGESIGLVGSAPELGSWNLTTCLHLRTSADRYPLWWTETPIQFQIPPSAPESSRVEYQYVRFCTDGRVQWETIGQNRWIPIDSQPRSSGAIVVDDGAFGYEQPYPFGYVEQEQVERVDGATPPPVSLSKRWLNKWSARKPKGLKIVVIGSSVALGYKSWLLQGWAERLGQSLYQLYGHQLVNGSEVGATVSRTIERFAAVVPPEQPDVVIIALSLGNEGLAHCPPQERRAVQQRFENGLLQLVKMTRSVGARPMLGGVYPNGEYTPEHYELVRDTHNRMLNWGIPVLDWLAAVSDSQGRWQEGLSFDPAHPNTIGHQRMYEAIDQQLFQIDQADLAYEKQRLHHPLPTPVYFDRAGFQLSACWEEKQVWMTNMSSYGYSVTPEWQVLQAAIQRKAGLTPGIYLAQQPQPGILPFFTVSEERTILTPLEIPPGVDLEYRSTFDLISPENPDLLFQEGHLSVLRQGDRQLWILNESTHEFNIHPMWTAVRSALKAMPSGVYDDPLYPNTPFRTMMIGPEGLESRVKVPAQSAVLFQYKCELSEIHRVAIVPLGARCAARMLLYKMEYDGPAFPFDLTRTTQLGDVADMIATGFQDMWNPDFLHYSAIENRIYHHKWSGLSFAHEVEETDDPIHNMVPIYQRMQSRYQLRAERFWYTLRQSDKLLFVRNGFADRGSVLDLMDKLAAKCQGKPFHLLIISLQPSEEYADISNVIHYQLDFNPDRMYDDPGYWQHCTEVMRRIIESLGISSKNLFWCPPQPPRDERSDRA